MQSHAPRREAESASERASVHPGTISGTKPNDGSAESSDHADHVVRAAREYLRAGATGLPCVDLAVALADVVLGGRTVTLALKVLEGGPFAHARATELAERVLSAREARPTGALERERGAALVTPNGLSFSK